MNISSIVVQALPKHIDALVAYFQEASYVDYHMHDKAKGKIIVTIEGKGVEEEIEKLIKIQRLPEVIAADMMMTYQEEELDEEIRRLEAEDPVPEVLNDETIDPRDVVYHGDLKHKKLGF